MIGFSHILFNDQYHKCYVYFFSKFAIFFQPANFTEFQRLFLLNQNQQGFNFSTALISSFLDQPKIKTPTSAKRRPIVEASPITEDPKDADGQQLTFFGALVAQRALRRFLMPHKGLFSKLNLRRFSRLCKFSNSFHLINLYNDKLLIGGMEIFDSHLETAPFLSY